MLDVKNLEITIDNKKIVKDINFCLARGEVLGIIGESGSGKSMICRSILGLNKLYNKNIQESGEILFDNKNLITLADGEFRFIRGESISIIFQNALSSLNPLRKIGKQIEEVFILHTKLSKKEIKEKSLQLLKDVTIENPEKVYNMYPHELSGGMAQRVVIAIALALRPKILIADEPTTSLDYETEEQIISLILRLAKKYKTSVIFVSHDLDVVKNIANRVLLIRKGKLVEEGKVEDFFNNPRSEYAKNLIKCTNLEKRSDGKFYTVEEEKQC